MSVWQLLLVVDEVDLVVDDEGGSGGVLETWMLVLDCGGAGFELVDLLDDEDEDELDDVDPLVLLWVVLPVAAVGADVGADDWLVPSVATCSSRTGGWSGGGGRWTPVANKATAAAPRNAPTAIRNGAPRWSSTVYFYWVNPSGSSETEKLPKVDLGEILTDLGHKKERTTGLEPATLTLAR
jgi:hypothetical protein